MAYLRLRVRELLKEAGTNLHQAMQRGGFSYPTMHRYMAYPDQVESLHTPSVLALLITALGYTATEIEALPMGHFFEVICDCEPKEPDWLKLYYTLAESYQVHIDQINDPILAGLASTQLSRLAYLTKVAERPAPPAERQRYLLGLMKDRLSAWTAVSRETIGEDPVLTGLAQEVMIRLEELEHELDENGGQPLSIKERS